MKIKALFCLIFFCISVVAQEGSYTIKCFTTDSKDSTINVVDVRDGQALIHSLNKISQKPLDILISAKENKLKAATNANTALMKDMCATKEMELVINKEKGG